MVRETTVSLAQLAEQAEQLVRDGIRPPIPGDLVAAAERLVTLMVTLPAMPAARLVVELTHPGEQVTAAVLQQRLAAIGRPTKPSAISVALHRAALRGALERTAPGRYRQPVGHDAAEGPPREEEMEVSPSAEMDVAPLSKEAPL